MSFEYFGEHEKPSKLPDGGKPSRQERIASIFRAFSRKRGLHSLNQQRLEVVSEAVLEPETIRELLGVIAAQYMDAASNGQLSPGV